ncbi:MAG: YvcK family protein [Planctomycetes bacterium]|nr:YvcK family protein [Planctomycetota bacterium]
MVTIGAGTGHAAILRGLRDLSVDLTAIVGVTDNGGHTGVIRKALGGPALGDARHCLEALCPDERWRAILAARGTRGPMRGASAGNLILAALARQHGSLSRAIDILRRGLGVRARLLPVSDGTAEVAAELADGRRVRGEWQILQRRPRTPISRVTQDPPLRLLPAAARAIARADLIVLAPGALWTALGAVLCTRGLAAALRRSRAPKVWVANILSQPPQLDSDSIDAHLAAIASVLGSAPDAVLVNTRRPSPGLLRRYAATGARWMKPWSPGDGRVPGSESGRVPTSSLQETRGVVRGLGEGAGPVKANDRSAPAPTAVASMESAIRHRPAGLPRPAVLAGDFLERPTPTRLRAYDRHAAPSMTAAPHWIRHDGGKVARSLLALCARRG